MTTGRFLPLLLAACALCCLSACTTDSYDTGDGRYSYLRADFVELHTLAPHVADRALTDADSLLLFDPPAEVAWAEKGDTTYRALLYYHFRDGQARLYSAARVLVPKPFKSLRPDTLKTDPLGFESLWIGRNNRYLNIRLSLKTGTDEAGNMGAQSLGLHQDTAYVDSQGSRHVVYRVLHGQNGVPQYYSTRAFLSLPLSGVARGTVFTFRINTYAGVITRSLTY